MIRSARRARRARRGGRGVGRRRAVAGPPATAADRRAGASRRTPWTSAATGPGAGRAGCQRWSAGPPSGRLGGCQGAIGEPQPGAARDARAWVCRARNGASRAASTPDAAGGPRARTSSGASDLSKIATREGGPWIVGCDRLPRPRLGRSSLRLHSRHGAAPGLSASPRPRADGLSSPPRAVASQRSLHAAHRDSARRARRRRRVPNAPPNSWRPKQIESGAPPAGSAGRRYSRCSAQ